MKAITENRRLTVALALALLPVLLAALGTPDLIRSAAGISDASGSAWAGLTKAVQEVDKDALIAAGVIAPGACVIGALGLMIGNRRGGTIILTAIGVLAFIGSVAGIVD
jgi:hypothetical protein